MTEPISDEELAWERDHHQPPLNRAPLYCVSCGHSWPCTDAAIIARLDAARQEIERLRPDAEKWRRMIERMVVRPRSAAQPIETEEP